MADRREGDYDPDKVLFTDCTIDFELLPESTQVYPLDECQWLLATSYNTGLECLQSVHCPFLLPWAVSNLATANST
jgi:hypothetical protein